MRNVDRSVVYVVAIAFTAGFLANRYNNRPLVMYHNKKEVSVSRKQLLENFSPPERSIIDSAAHDKGVLPERFILGRLFPKPCHQDDPVPFDSTVNLFKVADTPPFWAVSPVWGLISEDTVLVIGKFDPYYSRCFKARGLRSYATGLADFEMTLWLPVLVDEVQGTYSVTIPRGYYFEFWY